MNLAKPPRRGPKPKRPIKRSSRPARVRKTASGKAKHAADLAWANAVRESGPCAAILSGVSWFGHHSRCEGQIEAAHIVSRRYAGTRHDPQNGLPLCHGVHSFFTEHPRLWDAFVTQKIGADAYAQLKAKAQKGPKGIA